METNIKAPRTCRVKSVAVQPGDVFLPTSRWSNFESSAIHFGRDRGLSSLVSGTLVIRTCKSADGQWRQRELSFIQVGLYELACIQSDYGKNLVGSGVDGARSAKEISCMVSALTLSTRGRPRLMAIVAIGSPRAGPGSAAAAPCAKSATRWRTPPRGGYRCIKNRPTSKRRSFQTSGAGGLPS